MRKFINCDVLSVLNEIMLHNTENYREDFNIDKEILTESANEKEYADKRFLWMSRPQGTHCIKEKDAYLKGSPAYDTWLYYDEQEPENIIAYAVELTGFENDVLKGDLYELDFRESADKIRKYAAPIVAVELYCDDGQKVRIPYENGWHAKAQNYHYDKREYIPDNEFDYTAAYTLARADRLVEQYANYDLDKLKMEYGDGGNAFSIYQLKPAMEKILFEPYKRIERSGHRLSVEDYDMIYTDGYGGESLEDIYERFNIDHPKDFVGHSLSVSDVIVLVKNGARTAFFVDSYGFRELPDFFSSGAGAQLQKDEMEM